MLPTPASTLTEWLCLLPSVAESRALQSIFANDPLGLTAVLRMQIEKVQASWSGICRLVVEHTPYPVSSQTQHEALRITREALTNTVKHAAATEIVVELWYPQTSDDTVIRGDSRLSRSLAAALAGC